MSGLRDVLFALGFGGGGGGGIASSDERRTVWGEVPRGRVWWYVWLIAEVDDVDSIYWMWIIEGNEDW